MSRSILVLIMILATLIGPNVAQSYILPSGFLIRSMLERRGIDVKDVSLQLTAEIPGQTGPVEELLYIKRPDRMRLVQKNEPSSIYIHREMACAAGPDKALLPIPCDFSRVMVSLLLPKGNELDDMSGRVVSAISKAGIDTRIVSMSILDETPIYIIGAQPWETNKSQLWLDKNSYLPLRYTMIEKIAETTTAFEMRFVEYGGAGGTLFPRIVEEYKDGVLTRRSEVSKAQFNQNLPESLFDLSKAKR